MRTRNLLFFTAAALTGLTACNNNLSEELGGTLQPGADGEMPVNFAAYTSRGTTRAGLTGAMTNDRLKVNADANSFGVFGYYTNAEDYASDHRPNFMFNQKVTWNSGNYVFDYSPVRYWPNEYGSTAQSEDIDKVSFFAYAPYVAVNPSTGYLADAGEGNEKATWGITGTTRNTYTGDPLVRYVTSFDMDKSVDLCWGVYNEGGGWNIMNGSQTITPGKPWLNVQRAGSVDQRLKFTFRHATARLNVQVDANVDDGGNSTELGTHYDTGGNVTDNATKVYVRSVTFTGVASQGALNLNNVKDGVPLWMNYSGTGWIENGQSVTVHDGLRDGYEGQSAATANNETMTGLNPVVISNAGNTSAGVTNTPVNLFGRSAGTTALTDGVFVIPTGERVSITIVYDVETAVEKLPGYLSDGVTHGRSIENKITSALKVSSKDLVFEGGKSYTLKLHLGMNSVKFSAEVAEDWEEDVTVSVPKLFTVTPSTLMQYIYNGSQQGPTASDITVTDEDGNTLTEGTDYDIRYRGTLSDGTSWGPSTDLPTEAGDYQMEIRGKTGTNNYEGVVRTRPFTIELAGNGFSISSSNKVMFAPGNLQATYDGYSWTWKFAEHQWSYIGNAEGNTKVTGSSPYVSGYSGSSTTVDLFGWVGSSSTVLTSEPAMYGISNSQTASDYGTSATESLKSDWGNLTITNGGGNSWRTLTSDEWTYIFSTRTSGAIVNGTENARWTHATINTDGTPVNGMILFPDGCKIFNVSATSWGTINEISTWDNATKCTIAQWSHLESLGCVFLPAAGYRGGSTVYNAGTIGYYWSSSPNTEGAKYASYVYFDSGTLPPEIYIGIRNRGRSVRLVRVVE